MNHNLKKLSEIGFFDIKPGLGRITKVLTYLDNPQDKIKSVLIAGTNGKGSVASILSNILIFNNYKTGLYTSPHLVSVTERIKINASDISGNNFDIALGTVFDACETTGVKLSYFEIVTAAAFVYFENNKIDIAILEVGMGGRWDATNVVNPLISAITNISFDHQKHLGDTLELIASEKAEIIKEKVPVVSGVTGNVQKVLVEKVQSKNTEIYFIDKHFKFDVNENNSFNYYGIDKELKNLSTNLIGKHQIMNSSLALAAAELLDTNNEFNIDFKNIQNALKSVEYEGRFEILSSNPYLILDAAHNTASVKTVVNTIDELKVNKKFTFLVSMLKDKNHEEYLSLISGNAEKIVITKIPNERGAESKYLYDISKKYLDNVEIVEDYKEAFEYVKTLNTHVCITGSIYLIGLIKEYIGNRS